MVLVMALQFLRGAESAQTSVNNMPTATYQIKSNSTYVFSEFCKFHYANRDLVCLNARCKKIFREHTDAELVAI